MDNGFVDRLAQEIRSVDGWRSLGAGALAEALAPFIERESASALRSSGEAVACTVNGYLPRQRAVELRLDCDVPEWITKNLGIRAYLSATPASAWRPIAEAPTEPNARVILCCESLHDGNPPVVGEAYRASDGEWWWAQTGPDNYHADPIADTNGAPTLWKPLPTPPSSTKGG